MSKELRLWFWTYTDDFGKPRRSTWRMSEAEAVRLRDAVKLDWSLEVREPNPGFGASHASERWQPLTK